ncbi:hypothetical protein D3C77_463330 [compost metagenome]
MARSGDGVVDAHVMCEADPSRIFGAIVRESYGILVAEALHEHIQLIAYRPRIHPQLIIQLIHRQIEGVHHPVFAFVDHPEGFAVIIQQLRGAVIAANGMGQHKGLILVQGGLID